MRQRLIRPLGLIVLAALAISLCFFGAGVTPESPASAPPDPRSSERSRAVTVPAPVAVEPIVRTTPAPVRRSVEAGTIGAAVREMLAAEPLAPKGPSVEEVLRSRVLDLRQARAPTNQPALPVAGFSVQLIKSDMVQVPGGTYEIGTKHGGSRTLPLLTVMLATFWIGRTEVSVAQYQACVAAGACGLPLEYERDGWRADCNFGAGGREDHPINCITWHQAKAVCEAVGDRLPTEAEWEVAARGSDGREYPWGNERDASRLAMSRVAGSRTVPVDSMPEGASPFGALHMAGNVSEWVADEGIWEFNAYRSDEKEIARSRPTHEGELSRVIRGGGLNEGDQASATYQHAIFPQNRSPDLGVRCARDQAP